MVDIEHYVDFFTETLKKTFGARIWFVGVKDSYEWGEITKSTYIDFVVIIDKVAMPEICEYNKILKGLVDKVNIGGVFDDINTVYKWSPTYLFQLVYDTTPIFGKLEQLLSCIDKIQIDRYIFNGASNIYQCCTHNMINEKNEDVIFGLYKSALFVIQAVCFRQIGRYVKQANALLGLVSPEEQAIIKNYLRIENKEAVDLNKLLDDLFLWANKIMDR